MHPTFDTSMKVGGRQVIRAVDGYYIPINIIQRLPHIWMEPNPAEEFDTLPHVILTQGGEWDLTVIDHMLTDDDDWVSKVKREDDEECDFPFDKRGECKHWEPVKVGVQIDNPNGPSNEVPDDIEANFNAADATMQVHQAYNDASSTVSFFKALTLACTFSSANFLKKNLMSAVLYVPSRLY